MFGSSGLKDYGSATLQNLIPYFPWGAIQGKKGIKFIHLATLKEGIPLPHFSGAAMTAAAASADCFRGYFLVFPVLGTPSNLGIR